jgi:hypothetical protein
LFELLGSPLLKFESHGFAVSPGPSAFACSIIKTDPGGGVVSGKFPDIVKFISVPDGNKVATRSSAVVLSLNPVVLFLDELEVVGALLRSGALSNNTARVSRATVFERMYY